METASRMLALFPTGPGTTLSGMIRPPVMIKFITVYAEDGALCHFVLEKMPGRSIIKYYQNDSSQDDLVSIGTIGLIKAINTFDINKNIKLSSYASRCIENEILMHFRNNRKSSQDVSLNDTIDTDKDGNPLTLMDIIASDMDVAEDVDTKIHLAVMNDYINETLSPREKEIIINRYGIGGVKVQTQRELAKKLNISRSYISRIEKKALGKLKKRYEKG